MAQLAANPFEVVYQFSNKNFYFTPTSIFIQAIFLELLLSARQYCRHWRHQGEQGRQQFCSYEDYISKRETNDMKEILKTGKIFKVEISIMKKWSILSNKAG